MTAIGSELADIYPAAVVSTVLAHPPALAAAPLRVVVDALKAEPQRPGADEMLKYLEPAVEAVEQYVLPDTELHKLAPIVSELKGVGVFAQQAAGMAEVVGPHGMAETLRNFIASIGARTDALRVQPYVRHVARRIAVPAPLVGDERALALMRSALTEREMAAVYAWPPAYSDVIVPPLT
jgi:hypothetical protein